MRHRRVSDWLWGRSQGVRSGLKFFSLMMLGAGVVFAQAPPAGQPTAPQTPPAAPDTSIQVPNLSSNTNEVTLDLVVKDKKHKPVLDLKAEDFAVTDNDVPVKLTGFRFISGENAESDELVTLVFDHFTGPTAKIAQVIALKVLKTLPSKGYSYTVLDIPGRLRLIQGFGERNAAMDAVKVITEKAATDRTQRIQLTYTGGTVSRAEQADPIVDKAVDDAGKYLLAVARTGADPSGRHVDLKVRAQYQSLLVALQDSQKEMQDHHTFVNLASLLALIRSQQKFPERKSLIYFTQNMQMDSAGKEMVKTITGAAGQAGMSIYVVDLDAMNLQGRNQMVNALATGQKPYSPVAVTIGGPGGSEQEQVIPRQQEGPAGVQGDPSAQGPVWGEKQDIAQMVDFQRNGFDFKALSVPKNPLADLAKDTGGIYIDAQDSVKRPIEQMREDMTSFYQASYIPPIQDYDGSFRTIAVKPVNARLDIKTKTGYFALQPGAEAGIRPFEVPLLKLFNQSNLPHDVNFHAAVLQFGELPDGNASTVAVEVPVSSLEVHKDAHTNLFSAHVLIVAEIKDKSGTVVEHFGENISKRGALETLDTDKSASILMQRHFLAIPGEYMLDAAVYDENGLKYGASRIVFRIPPSQVTPSLSPIILVKHVDSINDDNDDPLEPMRYEKSKIAPNVAGVIPPGGGKNLSLFFILHPDPKSKSPATLEMEAARNGHPGRRTPLPLKLNSDGQAVPYLASFKGTSLAPGNYEVKAMLTQDGKTAVEQVAFTVEGDANAAGSAAAEGHGGGAEDLASSSEVNDSYNGGLLAITPVTNPVQPLAAEEVEKLLADTREHSLGYTESLPNFMCVEVTNRSVDTNGSGNWKHRDTIAELLRYREKTENHTVLEINGQASTVDRDALLKEKGSTLSGGELGGVLKAVFSPSAKADFTWKETDSLGSGTVQVFDYHVEKKNSMFSVVGSNNDQIMVAFHGQVFVDSSTHSVRRISLQADDLPKDFPTQATVMGVDYDYVLINGHDYLMPISAEVRVRQNHRQAVLNTIEFRDYRKYGSQMKILDYKQVENPKP